MTGIRLDHFAELNFTGFEHVINDLGGVSICLPYPISDRRSKLHLSAGVHHVMGAQALAYWRVRYIGVGSDLERIQRDQYLMASVAQEAKRANLLGNPARVFRIVRDVAASLTTDSGLSESGLINLAQRLRTLPLHAVHFVQVPVVTYPANPNWVQWPARAAVLFRTIARDKKLPRENRPRYGTGGGREAGISARRNGDHSPAPSPLSGLSKRYGGISAGANVCHDSGAFRGPLGGH
jgi:anionic cell wall polymer biosynthesis LytR-Cps2A-Psr (LCP) family protein